MLISAKSIFIIAAIGGATAVMLGAFGAHALQTVLSESSMRAFKTAVHYQMWHCCVLLILGLLCLVVDEKYWWQLAASFFIAGVVLFSGSLYALAFGAPKFIGPVTPVGGLLLIVAWLVTLTAAVKMS